MHVCHVEKMHYISEMMISPERGQKSQKYFFGPWLYDSIYIHIFLTSRWKYPRARLIDHESASKSRPLIYAAPAQRMLSEWCLIDFADELVPALVILTDNIEKPAMSPVAAPRLSFACASW